jgi:O-antigen/teichoic acid export membrane protein
MEPISGVKKIIKSSSVFFVSSAVVSILAYGFHLFAARFLSVSDYGSLQTLISLQNIVFIPIVILAALLTRIMAEHKREGSEERSADLSGRLTGWFVFPGIFILPALFLLTPALESFFNIHSAWPFVLLWLSLYLAIFQGINNSVLNGWHKFLESNAGSVANGMAKFFLGLFFMALGWGIVGGLSGIFLGYAAGLSVNAYFTAKMFPKKNLSERREKQALDLSRKKLEKIFKYSYPVILGIIAITVFSNVDALIAKHHFSALDAGRYGAVFVLSKIIFFAVSSLASVVIPIISAEKDFRKKNQYFLWIMLADLAVAGLGVLVFYLFPELVIKLLFGGKYLDIAPYLAKFGLLALLLSLLNIFVQYFISLKYEGILVAITAVSAVEIAFLWLLGANFTQFFTIILLSLLAANGISLGYFWKKRRETEQTQIFV